MQLVMENQTAEWREQYRTSATKWLIGSHRGREFTSDDLRIWAKCVNIAEPHHPNAWAANAAAMFRAWENEGRIKPTGKYVVSTRASAHARALKQYKKIK
jgi:hypothetical protein